MLLPGGTAIAACTAAVETAAHDVARNTSPAPQRTQEERDEDRGADRGSTGTGLTGFSDDVAHADSAGGSEYEAEGGGGDEAWDEEDGEGGIGCESSSSEDEGGRRRRKRKQRQMEPPNAVQRRLRSFQDAAVPESGSAAFDAGGSSASDGSEPLSPGPPVLSRALSDAEVDAQAAAAERMWELAQVFEFLATFAAQLPSLGGCDEWGQLWVPPAELTRQLAAGTGAEGVLARVHVDLLRGVSSKADLSATTWQSYLCNKLRGRKLVDGQGALQPLFGAARGEEALTYCHMSAEHRVLLLKAVVDLRADREDIRARLEAAANPRKAKQAGGARAASAAAGRGTRRAVEPAAPETLDAFRRAPVGRDAKGNAYYFIDTTHQEEVLLYREERPVDQPLLPPRLAPPVKKGASKAAKAAAARAAAASQGGLRVREQAPGGWSAAARNAAELAVLGAQWGESRHKGERALAQWVQCEVLPLLEARAAEAARQVRLRERLRRQIGAATELADDCCRSRRARSTVNYADLENAYDAQLKAAIRTGEQQALARKAAAERREAAREERIEAMREEQHVAGHEEGAAYEAVAAYW